MKKFFFSSLILFTLAAGAQETSDIKPAEKGVVYGEALSAAAMAVNVNDLPAKMAGATFEGKVTGKVKEVCKAMGCWMKLEKSDGTTLMVKTKEHQFFMPSTIVGKTVVMEGVATVTEETEAKRKHYAKDAGKTEKEIKKIKGTQKEIQFIAKGVEVID